MNPRLKVISQWPSVFLDLSKRAMDSGSSLCPSCGAPPAGPSLDRRFGIMSLRRCSGCQLLYRTPTDKPSTSADFYQTDYTEPAVTDLPDLKELAALKANEFASKGSLTPYLELIRRFFQSGEIRLVDYGCSWGYNTWRFQSAGFIASGVEVSRSRCDFGKNHMGLDLRYSAKDLQGPYNVFFSSHVFEHVPSVEGSISDAIQLLGAEGGLFITITPNGSEAFREVRPKRWHELWGRKHPNFLDGTFWTERLGAFPHTLMSRSEDGSVSAPLGQISRESLNQNRSFDLSGEELITVAWLPAKAA